jgi:hypothetical protein
MGSGRSLLWSLTLLAAIVYMFSLVFIHAFARHLHEKDVSPTDTNVIKMYWGSVGSGMLSLFQCATGGADWRDVADPLNIIGPAYYGIFCLFVVFFLFVIMNTITALWVEARFATSMKDIKQALAKKEDYVDDLSGVFESMRKDEHGIVSLDEFYKMLSDPRMVAFLTYAGLEATDAVLFYDVLSDDGKYPVDVDSFLNGSIRMKGQALALDVQELMLKQTRFNQAAEAKLKAIEDVVMSIAEVVSIDVADFSDDELEDGEQHVVDKSSEDICELGAGVKLSSRII